MDGGDSTLMKVALAKKRSQAVITVTHIHRRRLLTTVMSWRRPSPPGGAIRSRSSCLIWDVKLRHLNKSLLQFLAPAKRPTRSSKMSTGRKTSCPNVELFQPSARPETPRGELAFFCSHQRLSCSSPLLLILLPA